MPIGAEAGHPGQPGSHQRGDKPQWTVTGSPCPGGQHRDPASAPGCSRAGTPGSQGLARDVCPEPSGPPDQGLPAKTFGSGTSVGPGLRYVLRVLNSTPTRGTASNAFRCWQTSPGGKAKVKDGCSNPTSRLQETREGIADKLETPGGAGRQI